MGLTWNLLYRPGCPKVAAILLPQSFEYYRNAPTPPSEDLRCSTNASTFCNKSCLHLTALIKSTPSCNAPSSYHLVWHTLLSLYKDNLFQPPEPFVGTYSESGIYWNPVSKNKQKPPLCFRLAVCAGPRAKHLLCINSCFTAAIWSRCHLFLPFCMRMPGSRDWINC